MLLLIYDLIRANDKPTDYLRVIAGIKKLYPNHIHNERSAWILKTRDTAEECYDKTASLFSDRDRHLVVAMTEWKASGYGINKMLGEAS